jgi:hypothetical protein
MGGNTGAHCMRIMSIISAAPVLQPSGSDPSVCPFSPYGTHVPTKFPEERL